jgi:TPP-dependent pyruvate/acetoin dehydrogenase alpha subunit
MSDLLVKCFRIRLIEEKIIDLYPSDVIQSPIHLSIGQEAVAVGVCENLRNEDWVFINYRGHAFYLAKGGPLPEFFAELMGKKTGLSKGKAGSMHLASPKQGIIGASAVVASTISHAVGAALATKIKNENNRVFVSNFGDGAMEQGVFFESLNFASIHKLPVLFLCEDNGLAVHTGKSDRQAFNLKNLIESFDIPFYNCEEGYNPYRVCEVSKQAINFVRERQSPAFLRVKTARYKEHVGPSEDFHAGYRSETEMNEWKAIDPLMNNKDLEKYRKSIDIEINQAIKFANESPNPTFEDLLTDVI